MSVFELHDTLESINGGCERFNLEQVTPNTGNINNAYVGTGQANQTATFKWADAVNWWSPCMSTFVLQLKFIKRISGADAVIPITDNVAYCDNFVHTLFTQVKTFVNTKPLDIVDIPHLVDQALTYSNASKNFLDSYASMSRVGEPLMTRIKNTCTNGGVVEVAFRPPASLFQCKLLPPGAEFRCDFNWASNASLAFQYLGPLNDTNNPKGVTIGTTDGNYNVVVQGFTFYKASLAPSHLVEKPDHGVIDLSPCVVQQYFLNGGSSMKQNITLPSTTNRILIGIQDYNTTKNSNNIIPGVGNGYNPATHFAHAVSDATANPQPYSVPLTEAYLSLTELGLLMPSPTYSFNSVSDWMRAYSDWCHICQGTKEQTEGSLGFGTFDTSTGISIVAPNVTFTPASTPGLIQSGDPTNPQQFFLNTKAATALTVSEANASALYNQTCRYGWVGRLPILAFAVVRPENKPISTGILSLKFNSAVGSISSAVMASYSMAIKLEHTGNGLYSYSLIEGV